MKPILIRSFRYAAYGALVYGAVGALVEVSTWRINEITTNNYPTKKTMKDKFLDSLSIHTRSGVIFSEYVCRLLAAFAAGSCAYVLFPVTFVSVMFYKVIYLHVKRKK